MALFSGLRGEDPPLPWSILDDEEFVINSTSNSINLPIRIKSQKDEYSKSLSFSKKCRVNSLQFTDTPISMYNNILSFTNPNYNVSSALVIKSIKNYKGEFGISGVDAPSIYINHIDSCNLQNNIGTLYCNNIHLNASGCIEQVNIFTKPATDYSSNLLYFTNNKDVDYTKYDGNIVQGKISILHQPCVEIVNIDKSGDFIIKDWIVNACDNTRFIIKTQNKLVFNNIQTSNIKDMFITCKLNNLNGGLTKQFFALFDGLYKYNVWDNNKYDCVVELTSKTFKDIISYYNNNERYITYGVELPFRVKDVNLTDILDVSGMNGLENIVVIFNKVKLIITKNEELAKSNYSYQYKDAVAKHLISTPKTKDGWYIAFSNFTKRI